MIRYILPLIALVLFFLEPVFGLFSPLQLDGDYYYIVPRFLLMFLIFVTVYYDAKHAMFYGLFFGLLYDVFFIDIIGLYSFLYPMMCLIAGYIVKSVHRNLVVATFLTLVLTALFEFMLYLFFSFISMTSMPVNIFLTSRLLPTMIANSLFLVMLGWAFKSVIVARLIERENSKA
ncbi:rod shape-determining protein MreD [Planococcus halotolerans]|uniref:Rod shape-determining protein MreD n=1 Tax=Planococcus halotolerans TaxID=2233542 RepID=A0A365KTP9_9BACL|nr:rod shape-determining protein MreD [Planococcus halotolerans]QHJ71577.1 rod shape-determining protein MreD [Planococcus halotolerans]RAZ76566.1 rod shape-determining protein MreD [Planococcus halotolerans]